jgi:hypothetical protein
MMVGYTIDVPKMFGATCRKLTCRSFNLVDLLSQAREKTSQTVGSKLGFGLGRCRHHMQGRVRSRAGWMVGYVFCPGPGYRSITCQTFVHVAAMILIC